MPTHPSLSDAQSIVELGALVAEAKAAESPAEFKVTREKMGLSQPVASKLAAIGEHRPVFCKFYKQLPNSYHSLYALKNLSESELKGLIDSGALTPTTPVKAVEGLVAKHTLSPAVAQRKEALAQMAELGTLRCSLSVNPKPFLKELEQLLTKHRLIEFVQDGGMGTRALTAEVMEEEGQEVESELIKALRHAPRADSKCVTGALA